MQPALASQFGAGGFIGRASGRRCDARRWPGYPPYGELEFEVPVRDEGDVNARLWIRALEVEGAAHHLPAYAGNLDIMTSAAMRTAERLSDLRGWRAS